MELSREELFGSRQAAANAARLQAKVTASDQEVFGWWRGRRTQLLLDKSEPMVDCYLGQELLGKRGIVRGWRTIYRWYQEGRLDRALLIGNKVYLALDELLHVAEEMRMERDEPIDRALSGGEAFDHSMSVNKGRG